jgi:hypothetical protein
MNTLADVGGQTVPPEDEGPGVGSLAPEVNKMMIKEGFHGVVISGVVAWIQINNGSAATNIWRKIAEEHWAEEEVTAAKTALVAAAGEERVKGLVPGLKNRTNWVNNTKMNKEIQDIIDIVTKLENGKIMPLVLASSDQIRRCPGARGSIDSRTPDTNKGLISRMISMEETMAKFMTTTASQLENLKIEVKNSS